MFWKNSYFSPQMLFSFRNLGQPVQGTQLLRNFPAKTENTNLKRSGHRGILFLSSFTAILYPLYSSIMIRDKNAFYDGTLCWSIILMFERCSLLSIIFILPTDRQARRQQEQGKTAYPYGSCFRIVMQLWRGGRGRSAWDSRGWDVIILQRKSITWSAVTWAKWHVSCRTIQII